MQENAKLLNIILKDIFNALTVPELFHQDSKTGEFYLGTTLIPNEQIVLLQQEAISIQSSALWQMINNNVKHGAIERMGSKSENFEQVIFPKAELHVIDVIDKSLTNISKLKVVPRTTKT